MLIIFANFLKLYLIHFSISLFKKFFRVINYIKKIILFLLFPIALFSNDWVIDPKGNYLFNKTSESIEAIPIGENFESLNIEKYIYFIEDREKLENIQDVLKKDYKEFHFSNGKSAHFGYSANKYWGYFRFDKSTEYNYLYITFSYPLIDYLFLDCYENSGNIVRFQAGDHIKINDWDQKYRKPSFKINHNVRECWISAVSDSSLQFPTTLSSEENFNREVLNDTFVQSLYFGGLITILIYNLFLSASTRIYSYLLYCLFLSSYGLYQASFSGIGYLYLWPNSNLSWIDKSVPLFMSLIAIFSYLFAFLILDLKKNNPKIYKYSLGLFIFHIIHLLFLPIVPYKITLLWMLGLAVVWIFYLSIISVYLSIKGNKIARFFLLAWSFILIGTLINALLTINLVNRNIFTSNALQIGSAIEYSLLSILLGYRLNLIQKEISKNLENEIKEKTNYYLIEKEKAEKLSQFSILINREIDTEKILSKFYEFFESEFGIDGITIGLLDMRKNSLKFGYSSKPKVFSENQINFLQKFEYEAEEHKNSIAIKCFEKKKDFFISDTSKIPYNANFKDKLLVKTLGIKSFYLYPLYSHESKFGVIYLTQFSSINNLNRTTIKKIEPFLGQISATLYGSYMRSKSEELAEYHSVLREKAETETGKVQRLQEMTYLVIGSDTINQKLEKLNEILSKKYSISSFTLYILEGDKLINYRYFPSNPLPYRIMEVYREKTIDLNENNSIHSSVISTYKSILFKKIRRNHVSESERFIIELINIRNLFIIPLKVEGTSFGFMSFCDSYYSIANISKLTKN